MAEDADVGETIHSRKAPVHRMRNRDDGKPADLVYGVDDRPPLATMLGLALQHLSLVAIFLIVPVTIARAAGADGSSARGLVSLSMIGAGIAVALQAYGRRGIGSGYLVPSTASTIALPTAVAAVKAGGLEVLFALVMVCGLVEAAASRAIARLRPYFPPELAGLVVLVVGLSVAVLASERFIAAGAVAVDPRSIAVASGSLGLMIAFAVWGRIRLRLIGTLIGLVFGYLAAAATGLFGSEQLHAILDAPALAVPRFTLARPLALAEIVPFAIVGLAMALNSMGAVIAAQKVNDADWKRPDLRQIGGGVLAQGMANLIAGLIGAAPQSASSSNVGLSKASGATSRHVAVPLAIMLVALGFLPQVAQLLLAMPEPVMGAMLLFSASFLIVSGMQMIASRMLDTRKTFVIGVALAFAMSHLAFPDHYEALHPALGLWACTPMALAVTIAVALNLVFRIAIHRRDKTVVPADDAAGRELSAFLLAQGALWGAPPAIVHRAAHAAAEIAERVVDDGLLASPVPGSGAGAGPPRGSLEARTKFDEFAFEVAIRYAGRAIRLTDSLPTPEEIVDHDDGLARLAGYMIRRSVDRIRVEERDGITTVLFAVDN